MSFGDVGEATMAQNIHARRDVSLRFLYRDAQVNGNVFLWSWWAWPVVRMMDAFGVKAVIGLVSSATTVVAAAAASRGGVEVD